MTWRLWTRDEGLKESNDEHEKEDMYAGGKGTGLGSTGCGT